MEIRIEVEFDVSTPKKTRHYKAHSTGEAILFLAGIKKKLEMDAESDEKSKIIDNLTSEMEEVLQNAHAENYTGLDDDMPEAYEYWLEELSLEDLKSILDKDLSDEAHRINPSND